LIGLHLETQPSGYIYNTETDRGPDFLAFPDPQPELMSSDPGRGGPSGF